VFITACNKIEDGRDGENDETKYCQERKIANGNGSGDWIAEGIHCPSIARTKSVKGEHLSLNRMCTAPGSTIRTSYSAMEPKLTRFV